MVWLKLAARKPTTKKSKEIREDPKAFFVYMHDLLASGVPDFWAQYADLCYEALTAAVAQKGPKILTIDSGKFWSLDEPEDAQTTENERLKGTSSTRRTRRRSLRSMRRSWWTPRPTP